MDYHNYGNNRWQIVCGTPDGVEGNAVRLLQEGICGDFPYILTTQTAGNENQEYNLLVVGTRENNRLISDAVGNEELKSGDILISVGKRADSAEKQTVVLTGGAAADVLYAVSYFLNVYLPKERTNPSINPYFRLPFDKMLTPCRVKLHPDFAVRGIWTWGHCIYDLERYAKNMAKLGLNTITIWNDFAPANIREVVQCFHSWGIQVIFGFSFGWGEKVDIRLEGEKEKWIGRFVSQYENDYAPAGGDGVYFQSFTETSDEEINGISIAKTVVQWVNGVADTMLSRWPGLRICFGLHATSVKNRLSDIAAVDPRVSIHWEDCGCFPYWYLAYGAEKPEEMLQLTDAIARLRGGENFGAVLKGGTCLDWSVFEHQKGPVLIGHAGERFIEDRLLYNQRRWHDIQSHWMKNLGLYRQTLRKLRGGEAYLLVEDGLLESGCWMSAALAAAGLWTDDLTDAALLQLVSGAPDVKMA